MERTLPSRTVDQSVEVYANHGEVTRAISRNVTPSSRSSRITQHDPGADVPHRQGTDESTPDETLASADFLDEPDAKDNHAKRFCNTIKSSRKEFCIGSLNAKSFKNSRRVVRNNVNLRLLLDRRTGECVVEQEI